MGDIMSDSCLIFKNINEKDKEKLLECIDAKILKFKKDRTIASYINNTNIVGVILSGNANIVRYDFNGNRTIIEQLSKDSLFGEIFTNNLNSEYSIEAVSDCEVLFMEYSGIIKRCKKACLCHSTLVDNVFRLMSEKIINNSEKIEILMSRTIREKLRTYFSLMSKKRGKKTFRIPISYTDLADYLSIDRSAMMREIKNLKDDGVIIVDGKKITINY